MNYQFGDITKWLTTPTYAGGSGFGDAWDAFKNGSTNLMNYKVAQQNLDFQRESQEYNRALNEEIMNRADTAFQRQVEDMRAAGLNPIAMGASGAETGNVNSETPLQNSFQATDKGLLSTLSTISSIFGQFQNVKKMAAEANSAKAQAEIDTSTAINKIIESKLNTEEKRIRIGDMLRADDYNQRFGIVSGMSPIERLSAIKGNKEYNNVKEFYEFGPKGNLVYTKGLNNYYGFENNKKYENVASQIVADNIMNMLMGALGAGVNILK